MLFSRISEAHEPVVGSDIRPEPPPLHTTLDGNALSWVLPGVRNRVFIVGIGQ